jgi:hypothetical protein
MIKMCVTDPGPIGPITMDTIDDSAAVLPVFKAQLYAAPDVRTPHANATRMRSQTKSISRPPLPSPGGSAFSAVKSRIANMEEKVFESNQGTDGVIPFV